jgi:YHS domain-containing protein
MTVWLCVSVVLMGLVALQGCKTAESKNGAAMVEPAKEIGQQAVQTNCPIMEGMTIDKSVYTEHQGKKVYFCCAGCINTFKGNPEKYLSKLPQFNL